MITGLPKSVTVSTTDMIRARETIAIIVEGIKQLWRTLAGTVSRHSYERYVLCGRGALIKSGQVIEDHTYPGGRSRERP